jgi:hypothetical protein
MVLLVGDHPFYIFPTPNAVPMRVALRWPNLPSAQPPNQSHSGYPRGLGNFNREVCSAHQCYDPISFAPGLSRRIFTRLKPEWCTQGEKSKRDLVTVDYVLTGKRDTKRKHNYRWTLQSSKRPKIGFSAMSSLFGWPWGNTFILPAARGVASSCSSRKARSRDGSHAGPCIPSLEGGQ